jgi:hypothetical protein
MPIRRRVRHPEDGRQWTHRPFRGEALAGSPAGSGVRHTRRGTRYLASMGIYIFERKTMERELAQSDAVDFGRNIIPAAVHKLRVQAHVHRGYWEDVGTLQSYFQANLALTEPIPPFDFYQAAAPVYSHPQLPAGLEGLQLLDQQRLDLGGLHRPRRRDRAVGDRDPGPHRRGLAVEEHPGAGRRRVRDAGGDRIGLGQRNRPPWASAPSA